jgi:hypothetical protein
MKIYNPLPCLMRIQGKIFSKEEDEILLFTASLPNCFKGKKEKLGSGTQRIFKVV